MVPMALIWWIYHFWARFWPYFNFADFRAYFGPFSHVNRVEHENPSLNFNFWSITLKFFLWTHTTQEHAWLQGCSSIKKKWKMGHPNGYRVSVLSHHDFWRVRQEAWNKQTNGKLSWSRHSVYLRQEWSNHCRQNMIFWWKYNRYISQSKTCC